jgi:hypothetical protein
LQDLNDLNKKNGSLRDEPVKNGSELWFWVGIKPITKNRDCLLILELDTDVVPMFKTRESAEKFLKNRANSEGYSPQAMHITDIERFAKENNLDLAEIQDDDPGK